MVGKRSAREFGEFNWRSHAQMLSLQVTFFGSLHLCPCCPSSIVVGSITHHSPLSSRYCSPILSEPLFSSFFSSSPFSPCCPIIDAPWPSTTYLATSRPTTHCHRLQPPFPNPNKWNRQLALLSALPCFLPPTLAALPPDKLPPPLGHSSLLGPLLSLEIIRVRYHPPPKTLTSWLKQLVIS